MVFTLAAWSSPAWTQPKPRNHHVVRSVEARGQYRHWSDWTDVCSDLHPPELRIISATFHLEGDRRCGAWSECQLTRNTPDSVCYRFKVQGYEEDRSSGLPPQREPLPPPRPNPRMGIAKGVGVLEYDLVSADQAKLRPASAPRRFAKTPAVTGRR